MDWALAIRRNRDQLKAIVLALFALAGLRPHRSLPLGADGRALFTLPRATFAMIMLVLRPAEAALRRLIVIAAHGLKLSASKSRKPGDWADLPPCGGPQAGETGGSPWSREAARGGRARYKAFKLFDPLKHFDLEAIWDPQPTWESGDHISFSTHTPEPDPNQPLDARHLGQRLNALIRAIDTIPAQARRLARHYARRDAALKARKPTRMSPMRPGLPPVWRERKIHEIDDVLRECHGLANDRLNEPNTS